MRSVAVKSARYKDDDTASRLPSPLHHPSSSTGASVDDNMTTAQLKQAVTVTMKRRDDADGDNRSVQSLTVSWLALCCVRGLTDVALVTLAQYVLILSNTYKNLTFLGFGAVSECWSSTVSGICYAVFTACMYRVLPARWLCVEI